jgi:hypothetical protein
MFSVLQKGSVQWTKDGFGLGTDRAMPLYKRYQMVGRVSEGEYNLEIQNVTVEDSGEYGCQIAWADTNNPSQVSAPAQLVVLGKYLG